MIWQSALDSADTEVVLIYRLPAAYTKTTDTNPSVKMTFDVTNAISSQWFKVIMMTALFHMHVLCI